MDTRPTTQLEEGAICTSSEFEDEGVGQKESPSLVSEKVWGKRAVKDESAQKKRRTWI